MLFVIGVRTAGRIYDSDDQLVSTVFLHLFFIPLIPFKSVRVAEKGFLRDTGELAPLVGKSVWAAYLRHALLAVLGVGFAMAFSGLFLNDVVERDKPALVAIGTGVFAGASLAWLWASFVLGARATPSRFAESAGGRFSAGVAALVLVLTAMFAAARVVPRPLTLEVIAADRTRGDEEALRAMAKLLYPAAPRIDTARDASGITLSATSPILSRMVRHASCPG
jgi:hypothetical protein